MYSDFLNQILYFGRYCVISAILLIVIPRLNFRRVTDDWLGMFFSNFIRMCLLIIVLGYFLVSLKLYEMMVLLPVLFALMIRKYYFSYTEDGRDEARTSMIVFIFDILDGKHNILFFILTKIKGFAVSIKQWFIFRFSTFSRITVSFLFIIIFGVSAYLRFYDSFHYAAPSFADGYVTLAWMKYIDKRILFHDGIYPQGWYIYLDTLQKFVAIDSLYILKYTGPMSSLLTVLGLYFFVSRIFGNSIGGLVAASIYGIFGELFYGQEWLRQAGSNSQEFGLVFVFPSLYFYWKYLIDSNKQYLKIAFLGTIAVGLIHSLAFAILGIGMGALMGMYGLIEFRQGFKKLVHLGMAGVISVVVSLLPLLFGKMLGAGLNSSATEYLVSETLQNHAPVLTRTDLTVLLCLGFLIALTVFGKRNKQILLAELFIIGFCLFTFLIYYFGYLTKSTVITSRSIQFWGLGIPLIIGSVWCSFFKFSEGWSSKVKLIQVALSFALLFTSLYLRPVVPIVPYKLQWESTVEQYLRINDRFLPSTWMMVGTNDDYDLVMGRGYLMYPSKEVYSVRTPTLIEDYDPNGPPLTKRGELEPDLNIPPDTFIFRQKQVYRVEKTNSIYSILEPIYEKREKESLLLKQWLDQYRHAHGDIEVFYEDEHITVYHLQREQSRKETVQKIWNK